MLPISYQYGMPYDGTATTSFPAAPTPSFQDVQATAPIPIHQPWMPPSPSPIPSSAMASTIGPVYTMASTTAATTTVAPAPTTGAVVLSGGPSLQHPFTDGIFYRGAGVQQIQDAGEKSWQIEQPTDIAMEPAGKMLTHQVSAVSPMGDGHAVFLAGGELKLCGGGGWGGAPLVVLRRKPSALLCAMQTSIRPAGRRHGVTGGSALPSTAAFRHRPPRGRLRWPLLRLLLGGHIHAPLSSRWCPWDPGGCLRAAYASGWCPPSIEEAAKIKSSHLFSVDNNKISRDVKDLFLSDRFVSRHRYKLVRLQLEDELHVQVGCSVSVRVWQGPIGPGLDV